MPHTSPEYRIPGFTDEQNSALARILQEFEKRPYIKTGTLAADLTATTTYQTLATVDIHIPGRALIVAVQTLHIAITDNEEAQTRVRQTIPSGSTLTFDADPDGLVDTGALAAGATLQLGFSKISFGIAIQTGPYTFRLQGREAGTTAGSATFRADSPRTALTIMVF